MPPTTSGPTTTTAVAPVQAIRKLSARHIAAQFSVLRSLVIRSILAAATSVDVMPPSPTSLEVNLSFLRSIRLTVAIAAAVLVAAAFGASSALATIYSKEVTVTKGQYWDDTVYHDYAWVEACPTATFNVSGGVAGVYFAYGIGNSTDPYEPCIFVGTNSSVSQAIEVYNADPNNNRTFWVYGDY